VSVFIPKNASQYRYDFKYKGDRYYGPTGTADRGEAEQVEATARDRARQAWLITQGRRVTLAAAIAEYITHKGQFEKNAATSFTWFRIATGELGAHKYLDEIKTGDIQRLVARRRAKASNATVNRSVTQLLQRVWRHAELTRKGCTGDGINWTMLMLPEPRCRVRELYTQEETAIARAIRPDLLPLFKWAILTGMRRAECLELKWKNIDHHARLVHVRGKGDKWRDIPLTDEMTAILSTCKHDAVFVFTYQHQRASHNARRGQRKPITKTVLKRVFANALDEAAITNLRWHDLRHTAATRLLRRSGNVVLVQQLLGHDDITTTMKYAHTSVEDLRQAMETGTGRDDVARTGNPVEY
jgi:integrase